MHNMHAYYACILCMHIMHACILCMHAYPPASPNAERVRAGLFLLDLLYLKISTVCGGSLRGGRAFPSHRVLKSPIARCPQPYCQLSAAVCRYLSTSAFSSQAPKALKLLGSRIPRVSKSKTLELSSSPDLKISSSQALQLSSSQAPQL